MTKRKLRRTGAMNLSGATFYYTRKRKKKRKENRAAQKIVCPFQTFATQKPKARLPGALKIYILRE